MQHTRKTRAIFHALVLGIQARGEGRLIQNQTFISFIFILFFICKVFSGALISNLL